MDGTAGEAYGETEVQLRTSGLHPVPAPPPPLAAPRLSPSPPPDFPLLLCLSTFPALPLPLPLPTTADCRMLANRGDTPEADRNLLTYNCSILRAARANS